MLTECTEKQHAQQCTVGVTFPCPKLPYDAGRGGGGQSFSIKIIKELHSVYISTHTTTPYTQHFRWTHSVSQLKLELVGQLKLALNVSEYRHNIHIYPALQTAKWDKNCIRNIYTWCWSINNCVDIGNQPLCDPLNHLQTSISGW